MFDAHNHLQFAAFDGDREAVLDAARQAGVRGMVLAGYDAERAELARQLAQRPGVGATAGLHPWAVDDDHTALQAVESLDWAGFCAVGELGLDWVRAATDHDRTRQVDVFRRQLAIARAIELPVVLHCVRANDELAMWLKRDGLPTAGGMVHSFWGSRAQAQRFLDLGLHLSIGTLLTHQTPARVVEAIVAIGADRLLVETDAPSRPPAGAATERNEPQFLGAVVRAVAAARGESESTIADTTERNARALFGVEGVLG